MPTKFKVVVHNDGTIVADVVDRPGASTQSGTGLSGRLPRNKRSKRPDDARGR